MVVRDHFPKFIRQYPTKNRITRTAGKCLTDCVLEFGLTVKLLFDQDPTD